MINQIDFVDCGLLVREVSKNFGPTTVLNVVNLDVRQGEFFTLLGPSGCGKTTLLRIIAGLELPDSGKVFLDGRDITPLPASKRQINTVFQSYALFPHLKIYENVAFGLKARRFSQKDVDDRVGRYLEMLSLGGLEHRYPHQLSGGQKQRVALARALVNEPEVLLLDEPMSALDAHLRARVQADLRRLQRELGTTFIMVTHDQDEAMMISDHLAVMNDGDVLQVGQPRDVYTKPTNQFVAEFLGATNILPAVRHGDRVMTGLGDFFMQHPPDWVKGRLTIRPEHIEVENADQGGANRIKAQVCETLYSGAALDLLLEPEPVGDPNPDFPVRPGQVKVRTYTRDHIDRGEYVNLFFPPSHLVALNDQPF
ncbi:MAG: ABC transporter ATP-binding protein [Deltaproteobacteria bacterium]|nr:ABC transporter ATP-binding protein [Deltaproteobacteria bacterium]